MDETRKLSAVLLIVVSSCSLIEARGREKSLSVEEHTQRAEKYLEKKNWWKTLWHYNKAWEKLLKVEKKDEAETLVKKMNKVFWQAIEYKIENKEITNQTGALTFLNSRIAKRQKKKLDCKQELEIKKKLENKENESALEQVKKILKELE